MIKGSNEHYLDVGKCGLPTRVVAAYKAAPATILLRREYTIVMEPFCDIALWWAHGPTAARYSVYHLHRDGSGAVVADGEMPSEKYAALSAELRAHNMDQLPRYLRGRSTANRLVIAAWCEPGELRAFFCVPGGAAGEANANAILELLTRGPGFG